ncbi:MAG: hypothetical protein JW861_05175 [Bacteroidales bacterium]|nr:hypothetical protein [Bacteroidales bacterium]
MQAKGSRGWQVSIFPDEIQGRFDMDLHRELSASEMEVRNPLHTHLSVDQMHELTTRLTNIHFSKMAPYYIMRYGFYEGHTDHRADPVAIALVFGLKTPEEIEKAFPGILYETLTDHFTDK